MGLLHDPAITPGDLDAWHKLSRADHLHGRLLRQQSSDAVGRIKRFAASKPAYCSVSWGKDSVVAAHLCWLADRDIPLVWVRVEPIVNPCCVAVRDAYLASHPGITYCEAVVWCRKDAAGWHASGTLDAGFRAFAKESRRRCHITGLRADEAGYRKARMRRGLESKNTLAPIGWWTAQAVYGFLAFHDLPVCAVYAMSGNGHWHRDQIRVASLGGQRGTGFGRGVWEAWYFADWMRGVELTQPPSDTAVRLEWRKS